MRTDLLNEKVNKMCRRNCYKMGTGLKSQSLLWDSIFILLAYRLGIIFFSFTDINGIAVPNELKRIEESAVQKKLLN